MESHDKHVHMYVSIISLAFVTVEVFRMDDLKFVNDVFTVNWQAEGRNGRSGWYNELRMKKTLLSPHHKRQYLLVHYNGAIFKDTWV